MRLFQHLDEKLQHMDRELATNPQYVQKVISSFCFDSAPHLPYDICEGQSMLQNNLYQKPPLRWGV